jgi:hypothetical protein
MIYDRMILFENDSVASLRGSELLKLYLKVERDTHKMMFHKVATRLL